MGNALAMMFIHLDRGFRYSSRASEVPISLPLGRGAIEPILVSTRRRCKENNYPIESTSTTGMPTAKKWALIILTRMLFKGITLGIYL